MKRRVRFIFVGAALLLMSLWLWQSKDINQYVDYVQSDVRMAVSYPVLDESAILLVDDEGDKLKRVIQEGAAARRVAAVNAKADRVWKAIPGYNGLEVDIERTYELNKFKAPKQPIRWVMREVEPAIQLDDLGAQPIYKGNPNKKMASLMINVAWGNEYIPSMLETLAQEKVKATFFLDGSWLKNNVETAKLIQEKGHELSNHAYSHKNMSQIGESAQRLEISKTEALLKGQLGVDNKLFAPPSGDYNAATVRIAREMGLKTVLWTLDTVDWQQPDPAWIIRKISTRVEPGSLILMHPTSSSSKALVEMIRGIKAKGLAIGTVSELLSSSRVPPVEAEVEF